MKRILIIDDEEGLNRFLKKFFVEENFEVVTATNGDTGLEIFKQFPFDLTIVDLYMPGKNGVETIEEIRKIKPEAKIIVITGAGSPEYPEPLESYHSGEILDCRTLLKPLNLKDLSDTVRQMLSF